MGGVLSHRFPPPLFPFPTLNLGPGEIYCSRDPHYIRTVLGSCVAVCLWDQRLHFGGMNHFILPHKTTHEEDSCRFGDVAVPALVNCMINMGSNLRHLQAKIFGGCNVLHSSNPDYYTIGRRNAEIAISELNRYKIPVVASRLFGTTGLVIRQCTSDGDILVRLIRKSVLPS
ncbi:putative chemoreceptor glutamine deamidase CheD [Gammaproteobacteria bacterium]